MRLCDYCKFWRLMFRFERISQLHYAFKTFACTAASLLQLIPCTAP